MNLLSTSSIFWAAVLAALAAGCAPAMHPEIEQTEEALTALQADPHVQQYAAIELQQAAEAVEQAKRNWRRNKSREEAQHLSYLAGRRIAIAQLEAAEEVINRTSEELQEKRTEVQLESRGLDARR